MNSQYEITQLYITLNGRLHFEICNEILSWLDIYDTYWVNPYWAYTLEQEKEWNAAWFIGLDSLNNMSST
jgi:hypothetical protein